MASNAFDADENYGNPAKRPRTISDVMDNNHLTDLANSPDLRPSQTKARQSQDAPDYPRRRATIAVCDDMTHFLTYKGLTILSVRCVEVANRNAMGQSPSVDYVPS